MEKISFTYKKPQKFIDLVYEELYKVQLATPLTINRILWQHDSTIQKVNAALIELEKMGKVNKINMFKEGNPSFSPTQDCIYGVGVFTAKS